MNNLKIGSVVALTIWFAALLAINLPLYFM